MKPIISVQNLGKRYKLGAAKRPNTTLREAVYDRFRSPHSFPASQNASDQFWALRDVSFDVEQGEVFGIIGRNGAGKSTLLKILCRVTEPTEGRVELYGRTNSLLEVGTGFHPELTGRENIFVNGAILGLKKAEIRRLFDRIVEFAEVGAFVDTAVKHYSSGMYMRLAFSVAAHLEPEIMIVDEVLSVGDAEFQKKCLRKIESMAAIGRTVLFVSHNMAAVENLCHRAAVLEHGRMTFAGDKSSAIKSYLDSADKNSALDLENREGRSGSGEIRITSIKLRDTGGRNLNGVSTGEDFDICFHFERSASFSNTDIVMGFMIRTHLDVPVFLQHNRLTGDRWEVVPEHGMFVCRIRRLPLPAASYRLGFSVMCNNEYLDRVDDAFALNVTEGDFYGSGEIPPATHGLCLIDAEWRIADDSK